MASQKVSIDLSQFDQQRVAVVLKQGDDEVVFRGIGTFQRDDILGRILRIRHDAPQTGDTELILSEETWVGRTIPNRYGCRFCFVASPRS